MRRRQSDRPRPGGSCRRRPPQQHANEDPDRAVWSWRLASPPAATLNQNSTTLGIPRDSVRAEYALGVQSRSEVDGIVTEAIWSACPCLADALEGRETLGGLQPLGEV